MIECRCKQTNVCYTQHTTFAHARLLTSRFACLRLKLTSKVNFVAVQPTDAPKLARGRVRSSRTRNAFPRFDWNSDAPSRSRLG